MFISSSTLSWLHVSACFFACFLPLGYSLTASKWQTLSGAAPFIVARGGLSGYFPDSSGVAYELAAEISSVDVVLLCDVQLTKSGYGICAPDVNLAKSTNINKKYPQQNVTYMINGVPTNGWFSVDYTDLQLGDVNLTQGILSRPPYYDNMYRIQYVEDVADIVTRSQIKSKLWLNFQHDAFFSQHKLSVRDYLLGVIKKVPVGYISSPEISFLKSITTRSIPKITKLIFKLLEQDQVEPSTNQTYGSFLNNLTSVKAFASGILVPKSYIWPVDADLYLKPYTSLASDAHKAGLLVFAYGFSNDFVFNYNYSYDPAAEVLSYVDNGIFSVDGVLTDFPLTSSMARDCFAHLGKATPNKVNVSIITKHGASGYYPGCTDLAYKKAISDGADVIDCTVQFSADKVPICMSSVTLDSITTVLQSKFTERSEDIKELKGLGVYSFNLTWDEIQTLSPVLLEPFFQSYKLQRNPRYTNAGKFMTLSDFLNLAKSSVSLSSVLIIVENSRYLIGTKNISVDTAIVDALKIAGYDNDTSKKVMIQSTDSSLLVKFKNTNYELVYDIDSEIGNVSREALADIKSAAHSVRINKKSVFSLNKSYLVNLTNVVSKLGSANLSIYVETFSNEFVSQAWDFFSDPTYEINTYTSYNISGIVTDYPATAARYRRNLCLVDNPPVYMSVITPGDLVSPLSLPPAAPLRELSVTDVVKPPLPSPGSALPPQSSTQQSKKSSAQNHLTISTTVVSQLAVLGASLLLL